MMEPLLTEWAPVTRHRAEFGGSGVDAPQPTPDATAPALGHGDDMAGPQSQLRDAAQGRGDDEDDEDEEAMWSRPVVRTPAVTLDVAQNSRTIVPPRLGRARLRLLTDASGGSSVTAYKKLLAAGLLADTSRFVGRQEMHRIWNLW
jgi:hypothetical protein